MRHFPQRSSYLQLSKWVKYKVHLHYVGIGSIQTNTSSKGTADKKHRLVYLIDGIKVFVIILGDYGHYDD